MKKFLVLMIICFSIFLLGGCQSNKDKADEISMWDCSAYSAKASDIKYYDNVDITPTKGYLTFENTNDFDIEVYLREGEKDVFSSKVEARGMLEYKDVDKSKTYIVGVLADVEEGTELKLLVYNGGKEEN